MTKTLVLDCILLLCCFAQVLSMAMLERAKGTRLPRGLRFSAWAQFTIVVLLAGTGVLHYWLTGHELARPALHAKAAIGMVIMAAFLVWYLVLFRQARHGRWP